MYTMLATIDTLSPHICRQCEYYKITKGSYVEMLVYSDTICPCSLCPQHLLLWNNLCTTRGHRYCLIRSSGAEAQESTAKRPRQDSAMDFLLGDSLGNGDDERSPKDEVDHFFRGPVLGANTNPLKWWQANESCFPVLSKLAKRLLCIPTTSVPAERIFSTSGLIINKQRASLKQENIDMLVFLNRNLPSKASPVV